MHIQTVIFEQVFDIQRRRASRYAPERTDFSFESNGKKHYAVQVPGSPRISAGDTVIAVLGREGNWQTLAGWKNKTNGEVVLPEMRRPISGIVQAAFVGALSLVYFTSASTPVGRGASGFMVFICGSTGLSLVFQWLRKRKQALAIQNAG